jgi:AhpD family alkylhydroperoxidase
LRSITIVDRPLCCSSGACGPDPELARFADDLSWLEGRGVAVERINPSADPEAFLDQSALMPLFQEHGNACLPAFLVGGRVVSTGSYLGRDELAGLAGDGAATGVLEPRVRELVAIGAAIAANCEPCLRHHFTAARELGVTREEMAEAVGVAQAVKDSPAQAILELADRYLKEQPAAAEAACACGCHAGPGPSPGAEPSSPATPSSGCC